MGAWYRQNRSEGDKVSVDMLNGGHRPLTGDVEKAPLESLKPLMHFDELLMLEQRSRGPTSSHVRKCDGTLHKTTASIAGMCLA